MKAFAAFFDLLPGWLWALVVAALVLMCIRLDVTRMQARLAEANARTGEANARKDETKAKADLLDVQLASSKAINAEAEKARTLENQLILKTQGANDAINKVRLAAARAAADFSERVRQLAAPIALCPGRSDQGAGAGATDGDGGGGGEVAGLRGEPGGDLVVLDETAWSAAAQLAVDANITRKALSECVAGWKAASEASAAE